MFNTKTIMAHVFLFFTIFAHAQKQENVNKDVTFSGINFKTQEVNYKISKKETYQIAIEQHQNSIPKYFRFRCEGNESSVTVQISITDGMQIQTVTKEINIDAVNDEYQVSILPRNKNDLVLNSNCYIKSVVVINKSDNDVFIKSYNFSNVSVINEVNVNQVFAVDLDVENPKKYMIFSNESKIISLNVYKLNGELDERLMYTLNPGENYLDFSLLKKNFGKKVIQTSTELVKKPTNRIVVML